MFRAAQPPLFAIVRSKFNDLPENAVLERSPIFSVISGGFFEAWLLNQEDLGFKSKPQAITRAEQRDEKACATEYREHLQCFDFDVCIGGQPRNSLNQCSHLRPLFSERYQVSTRFLCNTGESENYLDCDAPQFVDRVRAI
jgi:hypothetical protein